MGHRPDPKGHTPCWRMTGGKDGVALQPIRHLQFQDRGPSYNRLCRPRARAGYLLSHLTREEQSIKPGQSL